MKKEKPASCQGYGTRSQGDCPFDFVGGTCRGCPESVLAFDVKEGVTSKNSSRGNGTYLIARKIKGAFLFFANRLKKRTKFLIGWVNNRRHKNTPCFECIKRGGICQPECEKRRRTP